MKKSIYILAVTSAIISGAALMSCDNKAEKVEAAQEKVDTAKQDLKEAKQELNAEYPAFKKDAEMKIDENDKKIAKIKSNLNKPGQAPLDDIRKKRIANLEEKNAELRSELYGYEKERTDWEKFKAKFNHDMDNVKDAFNDFGKDLKK